MAETLRRGPVTGTAVGKSTKRKPFFISFYSSAVGKKYAMALSGILLIGFVVMHMIGNLKLYLGVVPYEGAEAYDMDIYAHFLRELLVPIVPEGGALWLMRIGLIAAAAIHIHAAYGLTVMNRKARPVKYQGPRDYQVANFASRTMRWTGIIVLAFILWHLADLTLGWVNPGFVHGEVQRNVVASLERPLVAIFYIIANILLGTHLFHGTWSLFQSMGWNNPRFNKWRRGLAVAVASIVVIGNVSFPIMVLAGVVDYDPNVPSIEQIQEMNQLDMSEIGS